MIQINKFEEKIKILLSEFKERTNSLSCSILDIDGFILWTENERFDNAKYEKFLLSLYSYFEKNNELCPYEKTKVMSITYSNNNRKKGNSFVIRAINEYLYLISFHPLLSDESSCISEFNKVSDEIYSYLSENEEDNSLLSSVVIKATEKT